MQVCIFSCPLESRFWISLIIFSKQSDWEAEQKPASPQEKWHNKRLKYLQKITMFQFFSKNRETPQNGWFIVEHPLKKMDDLGGKPTIFGNIHIPPVLPSTKKKTRPVFLLVENPAGWNLPVLCYYCPGAAAILALTLSKANIRSVTSNMIITKTNLGSGLHWGVSGMNVNEGKLRNPWCFKKTKI